MDAVERLCITLDGRRYENRSVSQVFISCFYVVLKKAYCHYFFHQFKNIFLLLSRHFYGPGSLKIVISKKLGGVCVFNSV